MSPRPEPKTALSVRESVPPPQPIIDSFDASGDVRQSAASPTQPGSITSRASRSSKKSVTFSEKTEVLGEQPATKSGEKAGKAAGTGSVSSVNKKSASHPLYQSYDEYIPAALEAVKSEADPTLALLGLLELNHHRQNAEMRLETSLAPLASSVDSVLDNGVSEALTKEWEAGRQRVSGLTELPVELLDKVCSVAKFGLRWPNLATTARRDLASKADPEYQVPHLTADSVQKVADILSEFRTALRQNPNRTALRQNPNALVFSSIKDKNTPDVLESVRKEHGTKLLDVQVSYVREPLVALGSREEIVTRLEDGVASRTSEIENTLDVTRTVGEFGRKTDMLQKASDRVMDDLIRAKRLERSVALSETNGTRLKTPSTLLETPEDRRRATKLARKLLRQAMSELKSLTKACNALMVGEVKSGNYKGDGQVGPNDYFYSEKSAVLHGVLGDLNMCSDALDETKFISKPIEMEALLTSSTTSLQSLPSSEASEDVDFSSTLTEVSSKLRGIIEDERAEEDMGGPSMFSSNSPILASQPPRVTSVPVASQGEGRESERLQGRRAAPDPSAER